MTPAQRDDFPGAVEPSSFKVDKMAHNCRFLLNYRLSLEPRFFTQMPLFTQQPLFTHCRRFFRSLQHATAVKNLPCCTRLAAYCDVNVEHRLLKGYLVPSISYRIQSGAAR